MSHTGTGGGPPVGSAGAHLFKGAGSPVRGRKGEAAPGKDRDGGGGPSAMPAGTHTIEKGRAVVDTREAVLLALLSYEKKQTFSNVLARRTLDGCAGMQDRDRAFIKRLLEGVIERMPELDALIERYTRRSAARLHPAVRQILRMGIYQIHYMDAVPASAACNEAVKLARRHGPARLTGLVNGVLRRAAREAEEEKGEQAEGFSNKMEAGGIKKEGALDSGTGPGQEEGGLQGGIGKADSLSNLALRYSTPEWIVRMWADQMGIRETEKLLAAMMEICPVSARLSGRAAAPDARDALLDRLREAGVVVESGRWLRDSARLRRTKDIRRLPGFAEGLWTVQDESSMLAVRAAGLRGGETVYDLCAAPGGKSFYAADILAHGLPPAGRVYSFDLTRAKTDKIRQGAKRLSLSNLIVAERDARLFYPDAEGAADLVICDLPCSGLGVMGKKRDIKYRASREGIRQLRALQRQILAQAVHYVKPGGLLVYTTCTIGREENEENAAWIEAALGLLPDALAPHLPPGMPGIRGHMLQLLPHVHGTDGFFIARFRKPWA